jgi:MATE family multidrug resistance protein
MLINIPLTYFFIRYGFFGYCKGIAGAALASSLSSFVMCLILAYMFLNKFIQEKYQTHFKIRFHKEIFTKLLYFGAPSGFEMFLTFVAFSGFVALFHSYGVEEALSATIAFNWDIVAFMPVWGISIAIMSLVGQYMGARRLDYALRAIKSGAICSFVVMFIASCFFLFYTEALVNVFLPENKPLNVLPLASSMLKLTAIYCFANAANLTMSGALRAAGDTRAVMVVATLGQWTMFGVSLCAMRVWDWEPITTWTVFVCCLFLETLLFAFRFFQGKWKSIRVV